MKEKNKIKSFTIVETLITLLSITIMLGGPLLFMTRSYKYSEFIKYRVVASGLAQEGVELVTSLRNFNAVNFRDNLAPGCSVACMVAWDGTDTNPPTLETCDPDTTCALYKDDANQIYYSKSGSEKTDFYRYVILTPNGSQSWNLESVAYGLIEGQKVEVRLKKVLSNITIK